MKLTFLGGSMFGRNNNPFVNNPYTQVEHILKDADSIFFNLETTISKPPLPDSYKVNKVFNTLVNEQS